MSEHESVPGHDSSVLDHDDGHGSSGVDLAHPFRQRFIDTGAGRAVTATGLLVATLAVAAEVQGYLHTRSTREALLRDQRAEAAQLTDKQRAFLAETDAFGVAMATEPADDFIDDSLRATGALDKLFTEVGVYARVPAAEAKNAFAMQSAARYSKKDAAALCLVRPSEAAPVATCAEGSMCLGEKMATLYNLGAVNGGVRVLSPAWAKVVETSDSSLLIGGYDAEFRSRTGESRDVGKQIAEKARFAILVVDETPTEAEKSVSYGGVPPATATRFQGMPHAARLGVYDLAAHKPVLKVRRELFAGGGGLVEADTVARQIQSCSLGLEARGLVERLASAKRD